MQQQDNMLQSIISFKCYVLNTDKFLLDCIFWMTYN